MRILKASKNQNDWLPKCIIFVWRKLKIFFFKSKTKSEKVQFLLLSTEDRVTKIRVPALSRRLKGIV